jgi:ribonucleoside-diphosphate reductase alpha chain
VEEFYDLLSGIRCPSTIRLQGMGCTSARRDCERSSQVRRYIKLGNNQMPLPMKNARKSEEINKPAGREACALPECGGKLEPEGGCVICRS